MNTGVSRRALLSALGTGIAGTAGCLRLDAPAEDGGTGGGTGTEDTGTDDGTAADLEPIFSDVGLIRGPDVYDDLQTDIDAVGQGGELFFGIRYQVPVYDGSVQYEMASRLLDEDGEAVDTESFENNLSSDADGEYDSREAWIRYDTEVLDLQQGTYRGEFRLTETTTGASTGPETVAVDLVEPLRGEEVELVDRQGPDRVAVDQSFATTVEFRNVSQRDSTLVTDISLRPEGSDAAEFVESFRTNLPAGEPASHEWEMSITGTGTYTVRLDAVDISWPVDVVEN